MDLTETAMDENGLTSDINRDSELIVCLEEAADGGRAVCIGTYEAQTILAMMQDAEYREQVFDLASRVL